MPYYPLFLDITDKRCVVVGGGAVALRKVNMLLDHGAKVQVISPEICADLEGLADQGIIMTQGREYQTGDLEGAFVAIAATNNNHTNEQVANEAVAQGVLINVVDVPQLSNFIVPSYIRRGDLTVAISTNGKSPALSRKIRTELEKTFGEEYAQLTSVVEEVRFELKQNGVSVTAEGWQKALDLESLLELLRSGQRSEVKKELLKILGETSG
jgi:siroheme synthase-like protein